MQAISQRLEFSEIGEPRVDGPHGPVWVEGRLASLSSRVLRRAIGNVRFSQGSGTSHEDAASLIVHCVVDETSVEVAEEVRTLRKAAPGAGVVVYAESSSLQVARAALRAGARGFLHARMDTSHLARALHLVEEGETVIPRDLLEAAASEARGQDLSKLTSRQTQILELVADGLTSAQIARRLWLSESTIKQHLRGVYKQLDVKNRSQAAAVFRRSELAAEGSFRGGAVASTTSGR